MLSISDIGQAVFLYQPASVCIDLKEWLRNRIHEYTRKKRFF